MAQLDIVASFVLTYALHSVALGIFALLSTWPLRRHAGLRCVIWRTALFAAPFTAGIAVARSSGGSTAALSVTDSIRNIVPARLAMRSVDVDVREITGSAPRRVETVKDPLRTAIASIVIVVFAVTGLTGGGGFATRRRRVLRIVRSCPDADAGALPTAGIRVVTVPGLEIPVALTGRIIAIPTDFERSATASERHAILLHEAAHVERRDPAWLDAARLICALAPWQRLNRVILDRLERDSELAADTDAVGLGADSRALVSGLARFASRAAVPAASGATLIRADSPLVHRARQLLDGGQKPPSPLVVAGAACLSIVVLALLTTAPATTTAARMTDRPAPASGAGMRDIREVELVRRQPAS